MEELFENFIINHEFNVKSMKFQTLTEIMFIFVRPAATSICWKLTPNGTLSIVLGKFVELG